jgi:ureidoacrylate peracid hydrolase
MMSVSTPQAAYASGHLYERPAERYAPAHTALLIVDLQQDFCSPGGYISALGKDVVPIAAVVAPVQRLLAAARAAGAPVAWLTACYEDDLVPPGMLRRKREMRVERVCCAEGSWGAALLPGLEPAKGEPIIVKHSYSGFSNPGLEAFLRQHGVESLVLCGVQTNICVESTLRDGHSRGYHIGVAADAVASHTPPLHEATLANVRFLFGDVLPAADFMGFWSGEAAG